MANVRNNRVYVQVLFTPKEYEMLRKEAYKLNLTVNKLVRNKALKKE